MNSHEEDALARRLRQFPGHDDIVFLGESSRGRDRSFVLGLLGEARTSRRLTFASGALDKIQVDLFPKRELAIEACDRPEVVGPFAACQPLLGAGTLDALIAELRATISFERRQAMAQEACRHLAREVVEASAMQVARSDLLTQLLYARLTALEGGFDPDPGFFRYWLERLERSECAWGLVARSRRDQSILAHRVELAGVFEQEFRLPLHVARLAKVEEAPADPESFRL